MDSPSDGMVIGVGMYYSGANPIASIRIRCCSIVCILLDATAGEAHGLRQTLVREMSRLSRNAASI